jgi:hypothetical protein
MTGEESAVRSKLSTSGVVDIDFVFVGLACGDVRSRLSTAGVARLGCEEVRSNVSTVGDTDFDFAGTRRGDVRSRVSTST